MEERPATSFPRPTVDEEGDDDDDNDEMTMLTMMTRMMMIMTMMMLTRRMMNRNVRLAWTHSTPANFFWIMG